MSDLTVLGLPLIAAEGDEVSLAQPLAALAIVKAFDGSSEIGVVYALRATEGISTVEALGMARNAVLKLEKALWESGDDD